MQDVREMASIFVTLDNVNNIKPEFLQSDEKFAAWLDSIAYEPLESMLTLMILLVQPEISYQVMKKVLSNNIVHLKQGESAGTMCVAPQSGCAVNTAYMQIGAEEQIPILFEICKEMRWESKVSPAFIELFSGADNSCPNMLLQTDSKGNNILHYATASEAIKIIANKIPALIVSENAEGYTPLQLPPSIGSLIVFIDKLRDPTLSAETRKLIVDGITSVNCRNENILWSWAKAGMIVSDYYVRFAENYGVDPNLLNSEGVSLLAYAMLYHESDWGLSSTSGLYNIVSPSDRDIATCEKTVETLLKVKGDNGGFLVDVNSSSESLSPIEVLLSRITTPDYGTNITRFEKSEDSYIKLMLLLQRPDLDLDLKNNPNSSVLRLAQYSRKVFSIIMQDVKQRKRGNLFNPNKRFTDGCTILHDLAKRDDTEAMQEMVDLKLSGAVGGIDFSAKNIQGYSPLDYATSDIMVSIIKKGL